MSGVKIVFCFCLLLFFNQQLVLAIEVIKCQDKSGKTVYQDRPCSYGQVSEVFQSDNKKTPRKFERGMTFESIDSGDVPVYELTASWSNLLIAIPKIGMSSPLVEATRSHFELSNLNDMVIISGWFEPETKFPGVQKVWQGNLKGWKKKNIPTPQNVSFGDSGKWQTVEYSVITDTFQQFNIESHRVQAGTWIHLHLSISEQKIDLEMKTKLHEYLEQIKIRQK
jgi:hypothetical protein